MSHSLDSTDQRTRRDRRRFVGAWLASVVVVLPVAYAAGWLGALSARALDPVARWFGVGPLEASSFWSAGLVPLGVVVIGVPIAFAFTARLAAWSFDAEPITASKLHRRLSNAVGRATTTPVTNAIIDAPWVGAVVFTGPTGEPTVALTTRTARLPDEDLHALAYAAVREAELDRATMRYRNAITLPLVALHAAARSVRWQTHRVRWLIPILGVPAVLAAPPTTSVVDLAPTVALLMVAALVGLLTSFALSGIWMWALVAVITRILGPVDTGGMSIGPTLRPAPPMVITPLVHQLGRPPGNHRSRIEGRSARWRAAARHVASPFSTPDR